jgi:hypothetical protein
MEFLFSCIDSLDEGIQRSYETIKGCHYNFKIKDKGRNDYFVCGGNFNFTLNEDEIIWGMNARDDKLAMLFQM